MRRVSSAALAVVAVVGGLAAGVAGVAQPAAAAAAPVPGSYTAITPYRAADTYSGVNGNRKGALPARGRSQVSLAGHVPSTASAAVVAVSAVAPTTNGFLTLYRAGLRTAPAAWTELYRAGVTTTVTTIVPLDSATFAITNGATSGSTNYAVDVLGYYAGGTVPGGSNLLHPTASFRVVKSSVTLGAGKSVTAHVGPTGINSTVALMIHALSATRAGKLVAYLSGTTAPASSTVYYQSGFGTSALAQLRLGDDGNATFTNRGTSSVRIAVDQLGWSGRTAAVEPGALQPVAPERAYAGTPVGAGGVARFTLAGRHGMAQTGLGTALVAVIVDSPTATGGVDVGAPGRTTNSVRTVSFRTGEAQGAQVPVATSGGQIEVRNQSRGSLDIYLDVLGYYPSTAAPTPSTGVGRYLNRLVDSRTPGYLATDTAIVRGWAVKDSAAGARTVLLDLGAQTTLAPLSTDTRGIALAEDKTETTVDAQGKTVPDYARLSYADLAQLISSYVQTLGAPTRVLLAINNEGDWKSYNAGQRAVDFAKMMDAITVPAGITVVAAGDFEPGFDDNQGSAPGNALSWKQDYQNAYVRISDVTPRPFVFVGAASGCPFDFGSVASCTNEDSLPWSQAQLATLASGPATLAMPQIYNIQAAVQWANIVAHSSASITFEGTLSEFARAGGLELTAAQAHAGLYRGLSWASSMPYAGSESVDIVANGD